MNWNPHYIEGYSPLDKKIDPAWHVKVEPMPEEQVDEFLRLSFWKPIEALHVVCGRKISYPASYFITEEMGYVLRSIGKYPKAKNGFLRVINTELDLQILLAQWDEKQWDSALFLEELINLGVPLPDNIFRKIKVASLNSLTFESHWEIRRTKLFWHDPMIVQKIRKTRREWLQQNIAVQCLLFENKEISLQEMEEYCRLHGYIPRDNGYKEPGTFLSNVGSVLPKSVRGSARGKTLFHAIELHPLFGIFRENSRVYVDLRELKIVCQCIASTLQSVRPEIAVQEVHHHPVMEEYTDDCHPIVRLMSERWVHQAFKQ